jgi:ribosome-binding factor A
MPSPLRLKKIGDRIRQELSEMLAKGEIHDPRLEGITFTEVIVDRELSYANIFVSAVEGSSRSKEILEGLENASGFLRKSLAARVELRAFPRLRFHWDTIPENADKIERIIHTIHAEKK